MARPIEVKSVVRLSVVLDEELSEYVRRRAFEGKVSRSAYVRSLVEADQRRPAPEIPARRG